MQDRYLEITFRKGKPVAAYLYLSRTIQAKSAQTREVAPGLVADYDENGSPIGLEITAPSQVTISEINNALHLLHQLPMPENELLPLKAA